MTTLKDLPQELKEKKAYDIATIIRKYQDYKTNVAAEKLDNTLTIATRKNYVMGGVTYIKTGKKMPCVPSSIYEAIDKVIKECVQPLRPSEADKKRSYKRNYCKKEVTPPVARMDIVKKQLTAKVTYGIKLEDSVKCLDSYDEAIGFLKGMRYMGNKTAKMVSFEALEEVKI